MTKLYDGQLTDLIQNHSRYNVEVQAISYALQMEKRRLMDLTRRTRTMAMVDELPEAILDVLAVELRTPYYSESMMTEEKRKIIKNTLVWHKRSGTPSAVKELVETIFGVGEVVEWFNFTDGEKKPGTFDIVTNASFTEDIVNAFLRIIKRVKNARSHIRNIVIQRPIYGTTYVGGFFQGTPKTTILNRLSTDNHA